MTIALLPGVEVVRRVTDDRGNERGRVECRRQGSGEAHRWTCAECEQSSRWFIHPDSVRRVRYDLAYHLDVDCPGEVAS